MAQSAAILDDISANVDLSQASKRSPEKTRLPCNNLNGEIASPCYRSAYCTPSGPADSQIAFITDQIKKGYKVLVILRGLPGSGKSYLARRLVENTVSSQEYHRFIFSADDYFMRRGVYQYDVSKISDAHTFNQQRAFEAMRRGVSPVIIDNTNTQIWEMRSYGMVGAQFSYIIEVLEPDTPWAFNWRELDRRNTHRVPQEKLREMLSRYERNITADKLIRTFKINYKNLLPPQFRTYPPLHTSQTMRGRNHTSKGVEKTKRQKECIKNTDLSCAQATPQEQNVMLTVDDLLSYSDEDKNVLEPSIVSWGCEQNIKKDAAVSSDNNLEVSDAVEQKAKDVIVPDLSTWGISESALYSWDICTPISDAKDSSQNISNETGSVQPLETLDASTNTSVIDFSFAADPINKACTEGRVVATQNRDINDQCSFPTLPPRKKIMIDCSSMVGEDLLSEEQIDKKEALQKLSSVFPSVPHIYLGEMYEKCRGDINWAIDLLCDDNIQNLVSPQEMEESPEEIVEETAQSNNEGTDSVDESETSTVSSLSNNDADAGNRENLKKLLEEKVVIRDDFYSEHTLKLKSLRSPVNIPSTEEPVYPSTSKVETISTAAGDVIAVNSDTEMDDFDFEATSHSPTASDESEMIELNLGEGFVTELENKLKESTLKYPKGFLPVVQVPIGLARQLYALYIESVYQQMDAQKEVLDMLIKEDEEFAKKLQAEEQQQHYKTETKEPTTLPEIMQEQHTLRLCQRETEDWKNLTPDDLAAKLTKQKLFEAFPRIEKDVLTEIWQAHGNNYKDTVESILASDPAQAATSVVAVSNPPLSQEVLQEMKEAHDQVVIILLLVVQ